MVIYNNEDLNEFLSQFDAHGLVAHRNQADRRSKVAVEASKRPC